MAVVHQKNRGCGAGCRRSGLGIAVVTVALDQLHKWWMLAVYDIQNKGRVAITPFLDLVYVKNTGISYGLFLQETPPGAVAAGGLCRPRGLRHGRAGSPAASPPGWWRSAWG